MCLREVVILKTRIFRTRVKGDCKILPMCVTSALEARRLLRNGSEAYLARIVDKTSPKIIMDSVLIVWGFSNVLLRIC